ncbi:MAG: Uma2 family endonuclease [Chitinophagaceae bacterium]
MENEVKEPAPKYNFISPEKYLEMERASEEKHEYYKGEVFAMSGASWQHNVIVKNINTLILPFLKGKPCDMFGSDLRIHIPENSLYTYPDFSIICDKPEIESEEKDIAINPTALIEVLSKSTKNYDRGTKFNLYRNIKTLKEYILIDSTSVSIEIYKYNGDNSWQLTEFKELSDNFFISTIGLTLFLKDIYEDVRIEE